MTIALLAAQIRHERRVRLSFTKALASGAFTPGLYTCTNLDGSGASPLVTRALAVANAPAFVELQLSIDLVPGGLYRFTAVGVPGADLSITPAGSQTDLRIPRETRAAALGARGVPSDLEVRLYGRDVRWGGDDFAEAPSGDLDTVAGVECVALDLTARLVEGGLPWDPTWGAAIYEYVDAPAPSLPGVRGRALAQLRADDRVASADVAVDLSDPDAPTILASPELVGAALFAGAGALELRVPTS